MPSLKISILLILCFALFSQCTTSRVVTINAKEFVPKHTEYIPTTQIVRGTIHMDVPTLFAFPDLYMIYTSTESGASVVYKVPAKEYDSLSRGMTVNTRKKWKVITNRPFKTGVIQ
ncbi:MAG: hypothetical protein ABJH04_08085 [Cyclobacteriaceae bacterium]